MVSSELRQKNTAAEKTPSCHPERRKAYTPTGMQATRYTMKADGIDWAMASSCACPAASTSSAQLLCFNKLDVSAVTLRAGRQVSSHYALALEHRCSAF